MGRCWSLSRLRVASKPATKPANTHPTVWPGTPSYSNPTPCSTTRTCNLAIDGDPAHACNSATSLRRLIAIVEHMAVNTANETGAPSPRCLTIRRQTPPKNETTARQLFHNKNESAHRAHPPYPDTSAGRGRRIYDPTGSPKNCVIMCGAASSNDSPDRVFGAIPLGDTKGTEMFHEMYRESAKTEIVIVQLQCVNDRWHVTPNPMAQTSLRDGHRGTVQSVNNLPYPKHMKAMQYIKQTRALVKYN